MKGIVGVCMCVLMRVLLKFNLIAVTAVEKKRRGKKRSEDEAAKDAERKEGGCGGLAGVCVPGMRTYSPCEYRTVCVTGSLPCVQEDARAGSSLEMHLLLKIGND